MILVHKRFPAPLIFAAPSLLAGSFLLLALTAPAHAAAVWTNVYGGNSRGFDAAYAAVPDGKGDVIVTGPSVTSNHSKGMTTIMYSASGAQVWEHAESVPPGTGVMSSAIALDSSGDAVALGQVNKGPDSPNTATNAVVATYNPAGTRLSRVVITLPVSNVILNSGGLQVYLNGDFTVEGKVFVYTQGNDAENDEWLVSRYSSTGKLLWYDEYTGTPIGGGEDDGEVENIPVGAAVDNAGNLVVGGVVTTDDRGDETFLLRKYDPSGKLLFSTAYQDANLEDAYAAAFAMDAQGNSYIDGPAYLTTDGFHYQSALLVKFSPAGALTWARSSTDSANNSEAFSSPNTLVLDPSGDPITGGNEFVTNNGGNQYNQFELIKWDSKGHRIWVRHLFKLAATGDSANSLVGLFPVAGSDEFTSVFNLGAETSGSSSSKIVTTHFKSDGILDASETYDGASSEPDQAKSNGGAYDQMTGSLFVFGQQLDPNPNGGPAGYNWVTLKYQFGQ